jgi:hypothetical protein
MKAKIFVAVFGAIELFLGVTGTASGPDAGGRSGVLTARTGGAGAETADPALPGGPAGEGSTGVVSVPPRAACTIRWST